MRDDLMVQQQVANDWQHMVGVICLNQTGRKKVKELLPVDVVSVVIGACPIAPSIELTADSSVSVSIVVVAIRKKGAEAPV